MTDNLKEMFFHSVFENTFESMLVTDKERVVRLANKSFLGMMGYCAGDVIGKNFSSLLPEKDYGCFNDFIESVNRNDTVKNHKFYLLTSHKSLVRLFVTANALKSGKGEVAGYFFSFSPVQPDDWSSLKDPYIFQNVAKKLGRLTSVGQMTSVFAHDIKNPLHVILSTSELLLSQDMDGGMKDSIALISRNAQRASRIVKTLLDFSRSGMCQLRPYSLNDIVEYVSTLFESSIKNSKVRMEKKLGDVPKVFLDPNYLNSVVYNLAYNSVEAVGENGGEVAIETFFDKKKVRLKISDNGKGMERNIMENLFHPFFSTKENGTGLGLYLAKQIMNEHNGEIGVESVPGKGTSVTLTFSELVQ